MRVSIFNCVSNAYEMLRFSSESILNNAGTSDFDYIIVTWGPSPSVVSYLSQLRNDHSNVSIVNYETDFSVGYVPNLRGMMNLGFDTGFEMNDYCGLVNTDMYFGKNWLSNLVIYANENDIVNSTHITPIVGPHVVTANLGVPEYSSFDMNRFDQIYESIYQQTLETEEDRGGWMATNTMPYLFHRKFWKLAGPWELNIVGGETPDRRFFQRCKDHGAHFTMSKSSIVYHHEAVERRSGTRPADAESMKEEG